MVIRRGFEIIFLLFGKCEELQYVVWECGGIALLPLNDTHSMSQGVQLIDNHGSQQWEVSKTICTQKNVRRDTPGLR